MALTGCGLHGIKLSTFIYGVVMQNIVISSPAQAGIEVRAVLVESGGGRAVLCGGVHT